MNKPGAGIPPDPLQPTELELEDGENSDCSNEDLEKNYQHQPVCEIIEGEGLISFPGDVDHDETKFVKPNPAKFCKGK